MSNLRSKRLAAIAAFASIAASLFASCSANTSTAENLNPAEYEWAIFTSTYRNTSLLPRPGVGYVVFVRGDGTYDLVEHGGMDSGEVSWSQHGVYFADANSDYWITSDGFSSVKQKRVDLMDGLLLLDDDVTRVGVYNAGFQDDGYAEEVVVARPGASEHRVLSTAGFYPMLSACGSNVYGAYPKGSDDDGVHFIFDQIVKDGTVDHSTMLIRDVPFNEMGFIMNDAPCVGGRIYFLASFFAENTAQAQANPELAPHFQATSGGNQHALALVVVDSNAGQMHWLPITDDDGNTLVLSPNEVNYSVLDSQSLDPERYLAWVAGNGVVYKTDTKTGKTVAQNDLLQQNANAEETRWIYHAASTASTLSVLVEDTADPLNTVRIVRFDKRTGKEVQETRVKDLPDGASDSILIRDIASNPMK